MYQFRNNEISTVENAIRKRNPIRSFRDMIEWIFKREGRSEGAIARNKAPIKCFCRVRTSHKAMRYYHLTMHSPDYPHSLHPTRIGPYRVLSKWFRGQEGLVRPTDGVTFVSTHHRGTAVFDSDEHVGVEKQRMARLATKRLFKRVLAYGACPSRREREKN